MTQSEIIDYIAEKIGSENINDIVAYITNVGLNVIVQDMKAESKSNVIEFKQEKQWVN